MLPKLLAGALRPPCSLRAATILFTRVVTLLVLALILASSASATLDFSIGEKEVIYSAKQRKSKNLNVWPDGNIGVVANGQGGYDFYSANSSSPVKTTGTLLTPGASKKKVKISGVPKGAYNYVAGGPVYRDPTSGARLMFYHAEVHKGSIKNFSTVLGMAVSTDPSGLQFRDLGTIIEPNSTVGPSGSSVDMGGGSFAVLGDQLHVYYRDYLQGGASSELAVARAPLAELMSNALNGQGTAFTKYYNGGWSELGRGGKSSPLEIGNPSNAWSAVSYNDYLNQLVLVSSQWEPTKPDLYLATSQDGVNWSPRQSLVLDAGEQFYPSLIGTGADPTHTGKSFYVYYTDSKAGGWSRPKDAQLVRREITLDPLGPVPNPLTLTAPPQTDWAAVSDYRDDFQIGSPASGWNYAWNPTGTLGNASVFASLHWSNSAQAYNTTGGVTNAPGTQTHPDDFLTLTASGGGHPGQPKYMPILGYTIQAEDGAGLYRLADTSISKIDGVLSSLEDGLNVLVYVNESLVGPATSVLTNGQLANFDHYLGQLNVGDTVWVMVDPLKNQYYDSFTNFDFAIQKSVPITSATTQSLAASSFISLNEVPEPSSATLLILAMLGFWWRRRKPLAA